MTVAALAQPAEAPTLREIVEVLTLQGGFNAALVVSGTTLLGIAAGIIGTFAVLRRRALMGDALSHATLPGIAMAFLAATWLGVEGRSLPVLLLGAAVTGVLGVVAVQLISRHSRLGEDAAIGAVLSVFFGVGVVLLSHIQTLETGNQGGLDRFILGQTAAMNRSDATLMFGAALLAAVNSALFFKEFRLACFDPGFGRVQGWPVGGIDLLMMSLVVAVTVVGLQAVGLILVVAMIILPAASARFWTERLGVMTVLGGVFGGLSGYIGSGVSALAPRMPAGAVIVLVAGVFFVASLLFAPPRGFLSRVLRQARLRLRVARDHFLRALYEEVEEAGVTQAAPVEALRARRRWGELRFRVLSGWLASQGLIQRENGAVALTSRGAKDAQRVTRNHRLWEEYLVAHADVAPSHVDYSADRVEHILSGPLIAELEASLRRKGRLPGDREPPRSLHPVGAEARVEAAS